MFSISGLRGIAGKDLTREVAFTYTYAFGQFLRPKLKMASEAKPRVIIGRDTRKSGKELFEAVVKALELLGYEVINLGIAPTPTVVFMVRKFKAQGGIVLTASHNPPEYNGLKFISARGEFLNEKESRWLSTRQGRVATADLKLSQFIKNLENGKRSRTKAGTLIDEHITTEEHIEKIISVFKLKPMKLKVGVDATNGAGSEALPRLLEKAGCRVYKLNCKFSPEFPRGPEPTQKNIRDLCQLVKNKKLNLGFAVDPDCDRLSIVDENGTAIGEENTLVLTTDFILSKNRGNVVTNLSTTCLMDYITKKYGCRLYRTKVGEANVVAKMKKLNAVIGGEGNGGIIYPEINFTRDALIGAAMVLKLLVQRKKNVSEIIATYPKYYIIKKKLRLPRSKFEAEKEKITLQFKGKIDLTDGIRITTPDYWLHIRPSRTEPLVRIIGEAGEKKFIQDCIKKIEELLKKPVE